MYLRYEGCDENKENVINEKSWQKNGADFEAGQPQNFQHVDTEIKYNGGYYLNVDVILSITYLFHPLPFLS